MAIEIQFIHLCDVCLHDQEEGDPPEKVEGETIVLSLDGEESKAIELCLAHQDQMNLEQLRMTWVLYGRALEPSKTKPKRTQRRKTQKTQKTEDTQSTPDTHDDLCCEVEACRRYTKPFNDMAGKRRHMTRIHGA